MEQVITYFIKVNIAVFILYSLYWLLVRNKSNFKLNRVYLLSTLLLAYIFPFIYFPVKPEIFSNINQFMAITEFPNTLNINTMQSDVKNIGIIGFNVKEFLFFSYVLISFFILFRFILELIQIIKKIYAYDKIKKGRFTIVVNKVFKSPFSFLHYIFVEKYPGVESLILEHEKTHAKQFHTIDLFILQISSALLWINPFMHLLKKELAAQHEFLADYHVLNNGENQEKYLKQVIVQLQNNFNSSLVSKFNYSLTKKRLKMMKNINSKQKNTFKYLVLFITTGVIASIFAFTNTGKIDIDKGKLIDIPVVQNSINNEPSIWPIKKEKTKISSKFGMQMHPIYRKRMMHNGIDLKAERGTEIFATADGIVRLADYKDVFGNRIIIDHDNVYSTLYAHLSVIKIKKGDKVKKGDVIGKVGSTGLSTSPHLHYEVKKSGNWVNPENYIK